MLAGVAWGQTHDYYMNGFALPADTDTFSVYQTGFRGVSAPLGGGYDYFQATWTVVFSVCDTSGYATWFDLFENPSGTTAIRDSGVVTLKAGQNYNDAFIADSIAITTYENGDSITVIGVGDYKDWRNVHGGR